MAWPLYRHWPPSNNSGEFPAGRRIGYSGVRVDRRSAGKHYRVGRDGGGARIGRAGTLFDFGQRYVPVCAEAQHLMCHTLLAVMWCPTSRALLHNGREPMIRMRHDLNRVESAEACY